ncbi:hypothetical protein ILUMI_24133, partial [Ignelater luminosus]
MSEEKKRYIQWAKFAERTERFDDMAWAMKCAAETGIELTPSERDDLADAYKTIVTARRSSWMVLKSIEEAITDSERNLKVAKQYKEEVAAELARIAEDVLNLLELLIPKASTTEAKVFYLKMRGDYYRYLAEIAKTGTKLDTINNAQNAYQDAVDVAMKELPPTNPVRLGLALNYSVFYYDILKLPKEAYELARQ